MPEAPVHACLLTSAKLRDEREIRRSDVCALPIGHVAGRITYLGLSPGQARHMLQSKISFNPCQSCLSTLAYVAGQR